ncbi:MAG: hypothetical protein QM714_02750 [Nocardioides sp.]|uniref:hypothetical protein n=1 Tax=Nocardioides sp. TaxID=35761 RepID=UPI0039E44491
MAWETSTRRSRLPKDWAKRVTRVKRRARGRCEAKVHEPECDGYGRECDHIDSPDDHSPANLQWLSTPCHRAKTLAEAKRARGGKALRPAERHPGARRTPVRK